MPTLLVTGSAGLIGSESVKFFAEKDFQIIGVDNNMRQYFFGREANTDWNRQQLQEAYGAQYIHYRADIRDDKAIAEIVQRHRPDLIIHTAAQPSHDWAVKEPYTDFSVNAQGTLTILENFRKYVPEATFIFTSTNKVYGDRPNELPLVELAKRFELPKTHLYYKGIDESMSIDATKHSIFGASKVAADVLVQEYGRYFGLRTAVFRGGCLTGPAHSGTQLHGFLAYLIKCIATGRNYTIFGYKGKQVRDNIHSYDLVNMFWHFYQNPKVGEVYNAGGGRHSNISMLEAIEKTEKILKRKASIRYSDDNRVGDHMWYVSDVSKFQNHFPDWDYAYDMDRIVEEICYSGHFANETRSSTTFTLFENKATTLAGGALLSAHSTDEFGPVQALRIYLATISAKVFVVEHSLARTNMKLIRKSIRDVWYTIGFFLKNRSAIKSWYAINPLNGLAATVMKLCGFRFHYIYYTTDYSARRFVDPILNGLFHGIDLVNALLADHVWAPTTEIVQLRRRQGVKEQKIKLVRSGVPDHVLQAEVREASSSQKRILIDGFLTKGPALARCIKQLAHLRKKTKDFSAYIIPGETSTKALEKILERRKVQSYVSILPRKPHALALEDYGGFDIGICILATNKKDPALYKDPVEMKFFWAAGIPTVVNRPYAIAQEVENNQIGIAIQHEDELPTALLELLVDPITYKKFSSNARRYARSFSWEKQYSAILSP